MAEPFIRPIREEDVKQIHEIEKACFAMPWSEESILHDVKENVVARWLVLDDGNGGVLAYAGMWFVLDEAHVCNVAVRPDSRGLGYGKRIFTALIDLAMVLLSLFTDPFPYNLFPVIALANYFLFFGKDVLNVIPMSWRANASRLFRKKPKQPKAKVIHFNAGYYEASTATTKAPYTHRCTICGRTDVTNPELEFRYCSKCKGYYCYCQDHINNHTHIQ